MTKQAHSTPAFSKASRYFDCSVADGKKNSFMLEFDGSGRGEH